MALTLLLYVIVGLFISGIFILIPNIELRSIWMFFFLIISWLPLFLLGLVLISLFETQKFSF